MGWLDDNEDAVVVAIDKPVEWHEGSVGGEDRLNISPWPAKSMVAWNLARAKRVEKDPFS